MVNRRVTDSVWGVGGYLTAPRLIGEVRDRPKAVCCTDVMKAGTPCMRPWQAQVPVVGWTLDHPHRRPAAPSQPSLTLCDPQQPSRTIKSESSSGNATYAYSLSDRGPSCIGRAVQMAPTDCPYAPPLLSLVPPSQSHPQDSSFPTIRACGHPPAKRTAHMLYRETEGILQDKHNPGFRQHFSSLSRPSRSPELALEAPLLALWGDGLPCQTLVSVPISPTRLCPPEIASQPPCKPLVIAFAPTPTSLCTPSKDFLPRPPRPMGCATAGR